MQQSSFQCTYEYGDPRSEVPARNSLVRVRFAGEPDAPRPNSATSDVADIASGLPLLDPVPRFENFTTGQRVERGTRGAITWGATDEIALLAVHVSEGAEGLRTATRRGYETLLDTMRHLGFPFAVRVWNYLADINDFTGGLERYQQFCAGRFDAFSSHGVTEREFPSASALGRRGGDLVVYLLASRQRPTHFENPQQVSAYRYPEQYGPRSPSFARATLLPLHDGSVRLFVSGTASVIGHATQHPGDFTGQLGVTLRNLELLLEHVRPAAGDPQRGAWSAEILKVYLRHSADYEECRARLLEHFGQVPVTFVQADICRRELLVEIDGIWQLR